MLKSFELLKSHRNIDPFKINFKEGLNIIVGENGAGKSTLLNLITGEKNNSLFKIETKNINFRFLNTEKDNPRVKTIENCKSVAYAMLSRFKSHGETILDIMLAAKDFKNEIIFIDEPEAGISLKNQLKLLKNFENIINNNCCQMVVVTHSYVIIKNVEKVFSMDSKNWILSSEYLTKEVHVL